MRKPLFKSLFDTDANILRPMVGTGVINSDSRVYNAGVFTGHNALYKGTGLTNTKYDGLISNIAQAGTMEMWIKLNGWSFTNTSASDSRLHHLFNDTTVNMYCNFHHGFGVYFDISFGSYVRLMVTTSSWSADTWYHLAFTWDSEAGSNEIKMYQNGTLIGQGGTMSGWTTASQTIGLYQYTQSSDGLDFDGWVGGVTVYDYAKTDFSDRFKKRSGMWDSKVAIP